MTNEPFATSKIHTEFQLINALESEVVGLERGPLIFVRIIEELLEWKSRSSGLEKRN